MNSLADSDTTKAKEALEVARSDRTRVSRCRQREQKERRGVSAEAKLEKATKRANKLIEKPSDANAEELKREIKAAEQKVAS